MKSKNLDKNTLYQTLSIIVVTSTVKKPYCINRLSNWCYIPRSRTRNSRYFCIFQKIGKKDHESWRPHQRAKFFFFCQNISRGIMRLSKVNKIPIDHPLTLNFLKIVSKNLKYISKPFVYGIANVQVLSNFILYLLNRSIRVFILIVTVHDLTPLFMTWTHYS